MYRMSHKSAEVCDPSTTHDIAITSLYVTHQHSVKWVSMYCFIFVSKPYFVALIEILA